MCGDYYQSDLKYRDEKEGIIDFLEILRELKKFSVIEFNWSDIVRSGLVRDYIMTKEMRIKAKQG
jgi:phosphate starvation-inducible protein PhoH